MLKSRIIWSICLIMSFTFLFFSNSKLSYVLFITLLILPIILIILNQVFCRKVQIRIETPNTYEKDKMFICNMFIKNKNKFNLSLFECVIKCINMLTGEITEQKLLFTKQSNNNGKIEFCLKSSFCGCLNITIKSLKAYDVFGLIGVKIKSGITKETIIIPNTFSTELIVGNYISKDIEADEYSQSKSGFDPSETFAIREYVPGDSLSRIHWKLTAKFDNLVIKESGLPVSHSFLVLLDTNLSVPSNNKYEINDSLAEITISICQQMSMQEIVYEIGWYDLESNSIFCSRVNSLDELTGVYNKLMKTQFSTNNKKSSDALYETICEYNFEHIVYISNILPYELNEIDVNSKITSIICTDKSNIKEKIESDNMNVYVCTPENYQKELLALEV